jgi:hypothetical protein
MFELRGAKCNPQEKTNGDNVVKKTLLKKVVSIMVLAFGFLGAGSMIAREIPIPGCLPCPKDW